MFGRQKTPPPLHGSTAASTASTAETDAAVTAQAADRAQGKQGPTPKRRDQEAARRRPLVPEDRKAARKAEREAQMLERGKVRLAMETGDETHMPARDRGPQRRWTRDYVDARTGIAEWLMIVVLIYVFLAFVPIPQLQLILTFSLWALVLVIVVEGFVLHRTLKRRLTARFGEVERGVPGYGVMRALQLRRLRLPKPQVKRGQWPEGSGRTARG